MHFVYSLRSKNNPEIYYIGITGNIDRRLEEHANGQCAHTNKDKPWILIAYVAFQEKSKAVQFERYLKGGSGRAFAKRHF